MKYISLLILVFLFGCIEEKALDIALPVKATQEGPKSPAVLSYYPEVNTPEIVSAIHVKDDCKLSSYATATNVGNYNSPADSYNLQVTILLRQGKKEGATHVVLNETFPYAGTGGDHMILPAPRVKAFFYKCHFLEKNHSAP